ncbi:MAG: bifunctional folylpolyglutamate synthase/dihydrofolate synthase [Campylobacterales bacterium]|nr:bifunctional folylpolyglutamate synthase/dihydrofolate synthase [Campylobacterales bacterium]
MPRVYKTIRKELKLPKIIHLIGTNGKGTTGRFLATALYKLGYKTGHYSSPHILEFNERIWLNGELVSYQILESAHQKLLTLLEKKDADALSYFEYTTLLAILVYEDCDYIVLEAGLGGEHDATAVFENILTVVTPIGKDHEAFLGETIAAIATTKLNAVRKGLVIAQQPYSEVYDIAKSIAKYKKVFFYKAEELLEEIDLVNINAVASQLSLAQYLQDNLSVAIAVLKYLKIEYTNDAFENAQLFGRLSKIANNIILDVGHNVLAAEQIVKSLKGKKYNLIYNSYKDKNYREILRILRPIVENIEIITVEDTRIEHKELMQKTLEELGYSYTTFNKIDNSKEYLVFGSFSVAEAFLKVYRG